MDETAATSAKRGKPPRAERGAPDRFASIKTRNENIMAATMATW